MRYEIVIAGTGGQGVVLAGTIIGTAAAVHQGLRATQVSSYGPEARGGHVYTEVVISDQEIDYPRAMRPDVLVAMSNWAYEEFARSVKEGGIIIYDPDLVSPGEAPEGVRLLPVRATQVAEEEVGLRLSANMVMLGVLTAICDVLEEGPMREAIRDRVRRSLEQNLRAFELGLELGAKLRSSR